MLPAKILQAKDMTQNEISSQLGVCEPTVRNYLNSTGEQRKRKKRASKLDTYRDMVQGSY